MEETTFDIVVIGGGTGGYVAAIRAAQVGLKTALVEREKVGGTCLHRGCIPTKVMLQSADVYSLIGRAEDYGIGFDTKSLSFDYSKIRSKVDKVVSQLFRGVEYLLKKNGVTVYKGSACFDTPAVLKVQDNDGQQIASLTATNFLLSTGSRWKKLDGLSYDSSILDGDAALALTEFPKSVAIVGAGQTGVEFASFYRSFGATVHLIEAGPRLLPGEDAEVCGQVEKLLARRGINLYLNTSLTAEQVSPNEGGVQLNLTVKDKTKEIQAEKLILAIGRECNTDGLNIEILQPQYENGFIKTDPEQEMITALPGQPNAPGYYAIGDMTGGVGPGSHKWMLAHASSAQGIYVAEKLGGVEAEPVNYLAIPRCTYSYPQVASFGLTEEQARAHAQEQGFDPQEAVKVGKFPFKANGRALMLGDSEGFVKLVADADGDILGAHITGPNATELIAEPNLAALLNGTGWELAQSVRPHPALMEVVMEAARDIDGWAIHL